jgi:hypothetical protein
VVPVPAIPQAQKIFSNNWKRECLRTEHGLL